MLILVKYNHLHAKEFPNGLEMWLNVAIFTSYEKDSLFRIRCFPSALMLISP